MKKSLFTLVSLILLLYACKDEDVINTPELINTQSCQDHLTAENIFSDVGRIIEEGMRDNGQNKGCPNYILIDSDSSDSGVLIIDFGDNDCLYNGKLRKGKINISYSGKYRDSSSVVTSSFDNYYVNGMLVQGERIITNQGTNNNGNLYFKIKVNNASISTHNGTINWNCDIIKEWTKGANTYTDNSDDEYYIIGNANGNGTNGNDFTAIITDTLNIDYSCLPNCIIKNGIAEIYPQGYSKRIINYGETLCDCNVDIIIKEDKYPIVINN